jgi:hypothetical protein
MPRFGDETKNPKRRRWRCTRAYLHLWLGGCLSALSTGPMLVFGQTVQVSPSLTPPMIATVSPETRSVSAAEAQYHVAVKGGVLHAMVSFRDAHYPIDSMRRAVTAHASEWLTRLERSSVRGLQRDPAGAVGVVAGHEAYAKTQIAERLATPRLPLADRAFTLFTAVSAFADRFHPERFPTAETYLTQLDALGDVAAPWQFGAREKLMEQYYRLGRSDDIIRHGIRALRRIPVLPYVEQWLDGRLGSPYSVYLMTVESLAGRPNARPLIDSLTAILEATIEPPASLVAEDSTWSGVARNRRWHFDGLQALVKMLGTMRPPIVGNYWVNRPTRDSAVMSVTDGKIHVIVHGSYGCDGCLKGLYAMERIKRQFPDVQPVGLFSTQGLWGNRLVDPEVEAEHLNEYLTKRLKVTFPVAIWKGAKYEHEDGGYRADFEGPSNRLAQDYPRNFKPSVYVVDGHGRLRRFFAGMDRETEKQLVETITFLRNEAQGSQSAVSRTQSRSVTTTSGLAPVSSHGG